MFVLCEHICFSYKFRPTIMSNLWCLVLTLIGFTNFPGQAAPNLGKYEEENCTCVPYYLCNKSNLNAFDYIVINIRQNYGSCEHYMDVCCKKEHQLTKTQTATPLPAAVKKGCGYRHSKGVAFQITGNDENESEFGEFPWMVSLLSDNMYECGGSLIHPQVVVTTAHCITNLSCSYKIRAGEWDYQHNNEPYQYQERDVKSITIHPQYNPDYIINDIAFLVLATAFEINDLVNVVCLPPQNAFVVAGECYATGWNKRIDVKQVQNQTILKKTRHLQIPRETCEETLKLACVNEEYELHESILCARAEVESNICEEDEGSPLVCPIIGEKGRYYQAGIVVLDTGCGRMDFPILYANVANFREWIDEQMYLNGFEMQSNLL